MIFVTVGTHEQSFDRLLKWVDELVEKKVIKEKVIIQKGYTDFESKNCKTYKLIGYEEMQKYVSDARIVISHGGPASFIAPLSIGKIPIVVPRKKEFNEHVNDHQLDFAKQVEKRMNNIIVVETKKQLENAITNYNNITKKMDKLCCSNNDKFNENLMKEIENIM